MRSKYRVQKTSITTTHKHNNQPPRGEITIIFITALPDGIIPAASTAKNNNMKIEEELLSNATTSMPNNTLGFNNTYLCGGGL